MKLAFTKYERTLQVIRDKAIPKSPTNCREIIESFQDENIMKTLGRSKHIGNGIFYDGCVERAAHSFCVFSSKKQSRSYSSTQKPKNDITWVMVHLMYAQSDRLRSYFCFMLLTFNAWVLFSKLTILYVFFIFNNVFLLSKAFPFIFVLMSNKTEAAYDDVLQFINENVMNLQIRKGDEKCAP